MKITLRKPVDVPPCISAFCASVLASSSLSDALSGFVWAYDKVRFASPIDSNLGSGSKAEDLQGDFCHWVALINHFDEFFEKNVRQRKSLSLKIDDAVASPEAEPFPVADCLAILRTTAILLENTTNKHLYQSYDVSGSGSAQVVSMGPCAPASKTASHPEPFLPLHMQHLGLLLASPHPEIVEEALRTLISFVRKTHHATIRWHGSREMNDRLAAICLTSMGSADEVRLRPLLLLLLLLLLCAQFGYYCVPTLQPCVGAEPGCFGGGWRSPGAYPHRLPLWQTHISPHINQP